QPVPPQNKIPSATTDPRLGPDPVKSPIIAAPEKHRSVFGFGSIGRNSDGSMNGNPYAIAEPNDGNARCAIADYHPGQIPFDPVTEGRTRLTIPEGAYGSDGWGNDGTACLMDGNCSGCGLLLRNMQLGVGILGYTTPMDALGQGNFGADVSLNWATPRRWLCGLSAQAGGRLTSTGQNGIHGSSLAQDKGSTQFFWTSGMFFRNPCSQWQFGAVYDSLNSSYLTDYTIGQVRTELSHKFGCKTDLGFLGAFRVNDSLVNWWRINDTPIQETIRPVSWYSGFIRRYFDMGGEGMIYAGATENSEGLVGGRIEVPISDYISLKNDFAYVFTDRKGLAGQDERSWNVSITLTLYLGGNCRESLSNPLRPLFDVANNSTFLQSGSR
ncbi:MAG: hypothetical protein Q4G59_13035, partial [Planctomycetia bacterium]|nr:hypothetical protein [Planctomycetia bacterium]